MASQSLSVGLNALSNIVSTTGSLYAGGILNGVKLVVEAVLNSREDDESSRALGERVLEICTACVNALPKDGVPSNFQVTYHIGQLMRVLDRIARKIAARNQRGRLQKLVLKSRDVATLKELDDNMEQCAAVLSLHLQMDSLRFASKINASAQLQASEVEQAVAKAQQEELALIKSHFTIRSNQNVSKSHLPPPPQIFHGRSEEMHCMLQTLLREEASYVCILGTGGIGKTSFGLSTLHQLEIVKAYRSYRYFIPCDPLTDAPALLTSLANMFSIPEKEFWVQFPKLCRLLKSKVLLMLDNFETPWEPAKSREDVETVLSKLAEIPNLSLIVTLRGSERPYGVAWTRPFMSPLATLDLPSAKQIFLEISDVSESSPGLEELLNAVDMLPLAVTLIANQAQFTSCLELLELWDVQRTAMVTRGIQDKISNLDISIQVSLASPRLLQYPDALILLQILSVLPDGVDDAGLKRMVPDKFNTAATTVAVLRVGLAYRTEEGRLRCLSPVREHLQLLRPMGEDIFRGIAALHNELARYAEDNVLWTDDKSLMIKVIAPQIGNIHSVLALSLVKAEFQKDAVLATARIHSFHRMMNIGPNRKLLDAALTIARSLGDPVLEADFLLAFYLFESREAFRPFVDDILAVSRKTGDPLRLSRSLLLVCSVYLAVDAGRLVSAATEIIDNLQGAVPMRHVGLAYDVIIRQYIQDGNMSAAWSFARKGIRVSGLDGKAKADLLNCLAHLHACGGRLTASLGYFLQSAEITDRLGDFSNCNSHDSIGQLYFMQSHLALAASALDRAESSMESIKANFDSAQGPYRAARVAILTGDIALALSKCQVIHNVYLKGGGQSNTIDRHSILVQRSLSFAYVEVELLARNWSAASLHIKSAQASERTLGWVSSYAQVENLFRQADLLTAMGLACQSLSPSILAVILTFRQADSFGFSMALQRVGDFFFYTAEEETTRDAEACYRAELNILQDPNLDMGANRHVGDCLLRLGMVAIRNGNLLDAQLGFESARRFCVAANDTNGVAFCDSKLAGLKDTDSSNLPTLPLGNRLIFT